MANIPAYTADELAARIEDGSIDHIRLAATVGQMQRQVAALAEWANAQIQAQNQTQLQAPIQTHAATEPEGRKRK